MIVIDAPSNLGLRPPAPGVEPGVKGLADVRRFPASRRHPQFGRVALAESLPARGIEYRWFEALGGRRVAGPLAESPNAGLRVDAFRGYADYAFTAPFRDAFADLRGWAESLPVAICCAEALWWQCHRRILADHLVARDWRVLHILSDGRVAPHELWDLARLSDGGVTYPTVQPSLFGAAKPERDAG